MQMSFPQLLNQDILLSPDILCVRVIATVHIAIVQPGGEGVNLIADTGLAVRNLQSYCRPKSKCTMRSVSTIS